MIALQHGEPSRAAFDQQQRGTIRNSELHPATPVPEELAAALAPGCAGASTVCLGNANLGHGAHRFHPTKTQSLSQMLSHTSHFVRGRSATKKKECILPQF